MWQWLEFVYDQINNPEVNLIGAIYKLLLAMMLGVLVGVERKRKGQIAGIRTFALISMGSCMAMLLSIYVPQVYLGLKNGDPGRIAAQVITGIGFLGAGAMIHMKGSVRGLTTAAGIWMTATIGMAVGVGMYVVSVVATLMILMILVAFQMYEERNRIGQESRTIRIVLDGILDEVAPYRKLLEKNHVHLTTYFVEYDYGNDTTELNLVVMGPTHRDYLPLLTELRKLGHTRTLELSTVQ